MLVDLIIILLGVLFVMSGWKRGFIRSVYSVLSVALSMLLVYMLRDVFAQAIVESPVGDSISEFLASNADPLIADKCTHAVVSVFSVFVLYYLVRFLLSKVIGLLDFIAKLPLINFLNRILGSVFSAATGILWIVMAVNVLYFIPQTEAFISESYIVEAFGMLLI